MAQIEIGLMTDEGEASYATYQRQAVRFERGELAHEFVFPEVPEGSARQRITHFRIFHPDGKTTDVPFSIPVTIFDHVAPVVNYIDWTVIPPWSEEPMTIRRKLVDGDPMDPCSGDIIVELATLAVGHPVPEGWRVLSGNIHNSQIARVVLRYEIEPEGEN